MSDSLALLPATELSRRVLAREISAVEVLEACLERVEQLNPTLNAVVTLNPRAREEARKVDRRVERGEALPLAGLPVGIKDVTEVAGVRTTYGSPLFAEHVPAQDALVVRRFREAGAVILGKTNTPEFAAGGNTWNKVFGRTRNPWNPELSAGGSTGGGAAGLASGMIALAQGTDLGGSLRIPASFCGVVGIRPSVGLVPTHPSEFPWDTLQVTGPMGRTAEDIALALQAIAGPSDLSPFAQPAAERDFVAAVRRGVPDELRLAYCPDIAGIEIEPDVERVCREAAFSLEDAGATVEEIPLDLAFARGAFLALRGLWFVTQLHPLLDRLDEFGVNVRNNTRMGLAATIEQVGAAEQARKRLWGMFGELFRRFDYLLTPTMAVPPFPAEENFPHAIAGKPMETYVDWIAPTFVLSMTGLPVASVPAGLDPSGLPVGLQVVGRPRAEEAVLALAAKVQRLRPLPRPPRPEAAG
jgi:amidase